MIPRATYRLQFHERFTFADAEELVPYLDRLGISHVYASPITTAAAGSTHGYDVIDPTRINPELGGEEAFRSLVAALRTKGMGVIVDIVPNHMGVAGGGNAWWNDVLRAGPASEHAPVFDIDWSERLLLPVLGDPLSTALAQGDIRLSERDGRFVVMLYGEQHLPIRDEDQAAIREGGAPAGAALQALLDRQHYRLGWWRTANDDLNWRRFFSINELAGVRIEDRAVFEATHALVFRLYGEGLIDGVRVDHVDGLTDPAGYCRALRARLDVIERPTDAPPGPAYIVIEKILGAGERLATDWGVDGTSGYDFMEQVAALLHDPAGETPLATLWTEISGRPADFAEEELRARQDMLAWQFEGQLARCVSAFVALARSTPQADGISAGMIRRAIERLLWVFPVYRTYGTGDAAPEGDTAIRNVARERALPLLAPGEAPILDRILGWLAGDGPGDPALAAEAVRRFQQLSAPIAAKAVEDTGFYRHARLLSRTDVGFDARCFATDVTAFHAVIKREAHDFPHRMLATATHDHKRGEDTRARLAVLSEVPEEWRAAVTEWQDVAARHTEGVHPADVYTLFQSLFGAWPEGLSADDKDGCTDLVGRMIEWQRKALREAKLRSSWAAPDEAYEAKCAALVEALLDPARSRVFLDGMAAFVTRTAPAALSNSLAQLALRNTLPGVPDCYQGCELADLSLVDPDNRRPVDFAARERLLAVGGGGSMKMRMLAKLLAFRRTHPALFAQGDYRPIAVTGAKAGHVLAFSRTHGAATLIVAVALRQAHGDSPAWWGDTALAGPLPAGIPPSAALLFADCPVFAKLID